ncbi:MAG TPA: PAS domain-containing protein, partial [Burkholderiaceae bacterium]|nr:PAS domain-containing protein [Burkholderiaceae bacterium]
MTSESSLASEAARQLLQALNPADSLALLDLLPLGLLLMDSQDGRLLHLNREAERLLSLRDSA